MQHLHKGKSYYGLPLLLTKAGLIQHTGSYDSPVDSLGRCWEASFYDRWPRIIERLIHKLRFNDELVRWKVTFEGMHGKRPQVTPDLMPNAPFDLQTCTRKIGRRIKQLIRSHLGLFSRCPFI